MSSRNLFYIHALVAAICLTIGMSESYSSLAWAKVLIPLVLSLLLGSIAIPLVILRLAIKERRTPGKIAAAVTLSAMLSIVSFFVVLPLCT